MSKNMCGREFVRYTKDWTRNELESLLKYSSFRMIQSFSIPHGTMEKWSGILENN